MTPTKILVLVPVAFVHDGIAQVWRPGDVVNAADYPQAFIDGLWLQLSAANKVTSYDVAPLPLQQAVDSVVALRLRGGDVDEGASSTLLFQALVGGVVP